MSSKVSIGSISNGIVVRLVGRGTMRESPAFREAVEDYLDRGTVIFDATSCDYLDSTFLGCLIGLKKACEQVPHRQFLIAASAATQIKLFCTSSLDRYFDFVETCPETLQQFETIEIGDLEREKLGHHIMHCHERLAEMGGREAPAFQAIADKLAQELGKRGGA